MEVVAGAVLAVRPRARYRAFNIKAAFLRLGDFSASVVRALLASIPEAGNRWHAP